MWSIKVILVLSRGAIGDAGHNIRRQDGPIDWTFVKLAVRAFYLFD
jgi:hypothetical protein